MSAREILRPLIIAARTPAALAGLAIELHHLADELEARASALRHDRERPPAQRLSRGEHLARGPGRQPTDFIRIERTARPQRRGDSRDPNVERALLQRFGVEEPRLRLYIGKALYRLPEFGEPMYISLIQFRGTIAIIPHHEGGEGRYRIVVGSGMPRTWIDGHRELFRPVAAGRYAGALVDGRLVIGARIDP